MKEGRKEGRKDRMGARSQNPFSATLVLTEAADSSVIMNEARANCQVRERERGERGFLRLFAYYGSLFV